MFGGKKQQYVPDYDGGAKPANETQEFEYHVAAYAGAGAFNDGVNEYAADGWELVNGQMAGTAHYAYMRRRLRVLQTPYSALEPPTSEVSNTSA